MPRFQSPGASRPATAGRVRSADRSRPFVIDGFAPVQCADDAALLTLPLYELGMMARVAKSAAPTSRGGIALTIGMAGEPQRRPWQGEGDRPDPDRRDDIVDGLARYRLLDPIVERLASALDAAERQGDIHLPLYRDVICLAIVSRLAALGCERPAAARGLQKWRLNKVRDFVDANLAASVTLADLAAAAGFSRMHFAAEFRAATGMRPHEYLLRRRIERSCELLLATDLPIVQVAFAVGFRNQAHFTTVFKRFVQETPFRWRRSRLLRN